MLDELLLFVDHQCNHVTPFRPRESCDSLAEAHEMCPAPTLDKRIPGGLRSVALMDIDDYVIFI